MASNIPVEASDLGTPTAEYIPRHGTAYLVLSLITGILFSVLVAAVGTFLVIGAFQWRSGASRFGYIAFGLTVILAAVWLLARVIRRRTLGKRVLVFSEGLAYTQAGKTVTMRWDDIAAVWQNVVAHYFRQPWQIRHHYSGTTHTYTVQLNDGRKYVFNDALSNVEELGSTIQQESLHRILPRLREAVEGGQAIPFGALTISKSGIARGYNVLPWAGVKNVEIFEGFLNVYSTKEPSVADLIFTKGKGTWASIPVAKTPNVFLFKALADEIMGRDKSQTNP